jgi:hypothetical protein
LERGSTVGEIYRLFILFFGGLDGKRKEGGASPVKSFVCVEALYTTRRCEERYGAIAKRFPKAVWSECRWTDVARQLCCDGGGWGGDSLSSPQAGG